MIRPIKNINDRPQIEWYTEYSSTSGGPIVHKKEYDMALEIYCDHLEKALDRACEILEERLTCPYEYFDYEFDRCKNYCNNECKDYWKDYLLNGDNL